MQIKTTNAKARIAEPRAAVLAGGCREPRPRRPDDGSRPAAPADQPVQVLDEFGPLIGWFTELQQQRRDAEQELKHFDAAEASGYRLGGASRPELVARVEAAKAAITKQVAKILAVLRRGADASRRRGGREFLYVASQLDDELAVVEKFPAASSSALWHLHRIESQVLPKLREDLRKAEFHAVSTAEDEEPISHKARAVWDILLELPTDPPTGMTGPKLVRELKKRGVPASLPTLSSYVLPELKKHGMTNKPRIGYYIPKSARKES